MTFPQGPAPSQPLPQIQLPLGTLVLNSSNANSAQVPPALGWEQLPDVTNLRVAPPPAVHFEFCSQSPVLNSFY